MTPGLDVLVLLVELAALFFAVTALVALFQRRMGQERLQRWMGGSAPVAALKGIALGFATPFCTFTAVPMLVGLRQAGVRSAGYTAFVVAAPVLDPVLFGALILIAGPKAAGVYSVVAFVGAFTLAMISEAVTLDRFLTPIQEMIGAEPSRESSCSPRAEEPWRGLRGELWPAVRAASALLRSLAPVLLAGVLLSVMIDSFVPPDVMARITSVSPDYAVPAAAVLGTPLYVSTAVLIPVADALLAAGVGIGAVVALTIAGAGANLPEFVVLSRLAQPRVIVGFFAYVMAVAVVGGLLAQGFLA